MNTRNFLVRLSEEEHAALKRLAESERRSMQDVVRLAVHDRASAATRRAEVQADLEDIIDRDRELLDRLAR